MTEAIFEDILSKNFQKLMHVSTNGVGKTENFMKKNAAAPFLMPYLKKLTQSESRHECKTYYYGSQK